MPVGVTKLYVNLGFGADNKIHNPQQQPLGSTGKQNCNPQMHIVPAMATVIIK